MLKKLLLFALLCYGLLVSAQVKAPVELPVFETFQRYDNGAVFTADSLSNIGKNVLVFYDPGCGHCQELGHSFSQNWEKWSDEVNFYFISMTEKELVDTYVDKYAKNLKGKKNVVFLFDEKGEFIYRFDPKNFPSTYIYTADTRQLIEMYDGANTTKDMEKYLAIK